MTQDNYIYLFMLMEINIFSLNLQHCNKAQSAEVPALRQIEPWHVTACPCTAKLKGYKNNEAQIQNTVRWAVILRLPKKDNSPSFVFFLSLMLKIP